MKYYFIENVYLKTSWRKKNLYIHIREEVERYLSIDSLYSIYVVIQEGQE